MARTALAVSEFAFAATLMFAAPAVFAYDDAPPSAARRQELTHLLRHDCGACHGLKLAGGLGPPLDPATLRGKPAEGLKQVILEGRPGTAMPGWQPFLTEREAQWMVDALMNGFSDARERT
jgi:cytochrome c55X